MVSSTHSVPRCCVAMVNNCAPLLESLSTLVTKTGELTVCIHRRTDKGTIKMQFSKYPHEKIVGAH